MSADRAGAVRVARRLREAGFEAWFAGGCVRDHLLGRPAKDWDIATDARPEQVQALFPRTIAVGAAFGVIQVVEKGGLQYEVATFRADGDYADGRRPSEVHYSTDRVEDVKRRDFTVNALLMDPDTGAIEDHVEGRADLAAGIIRAVGDPHERFREDRLRMLRAVRFSCRLGFAIEAETRAAIDAEAAFLGAVSPERITQELYEVLAGPRPGDGVRLLEATGLAHACLPTPRPADLATRLDRLPEAGADRPADERATLGWALTHAEVAPSALEPALRARKLSRAEMRAIRALRDQAAVMETAPAEPPSGPALRVARGEGWPRLAVYLACDNPRLAERLAAYRRWLDAHPPADEAMLDGADLKRLGVPPGPAFKRILSSVEDAILVGAVTTKAEAEALVRREGGGDR